METSFQGHALCQAAILEGMSRRGESTLEDYIRRLWDESGPQFVVDLLKTLKRHTVENLDGVQTYHHEVGEPSIRWNNHLNRPKGPLSVIYSQFPDPVNRLRVIGALLNSIQFEHASTKQLEKLVRGIRSKTRTTETLALRPAFRRRLEKRIHAHVCAQKAFGPEHITATMLPYGHDSISIRELRSQLLSEDDRTRHSAIASFAEHVTAQFQSCPDFVRRTWNDIVSQVYPEAAAIDGNASRLLNSKTAVDLAFRAFSSDRPDVGKQIDRYKLLHAKGHTRPFLAREYESYHDRFGYLNTADAEYNTEDASAYLGTLVFLQQPGGKLRTVCNINRYANWVMEPFARALQEVVYAEPAVAVCDQASAIRWIQSKLKEGVTLTSLDLTSATDMLDFRVLTRALKEDDECNLIRTYANLFDSLAESPLWCEGLDCAVQFSTGQPLGLKGSFQVLTTMNFFAGLLAAQQTGLDQDAFRVVGDDFICDERMATAYSEIIESWGGVTNAEKALVSSRYGEFLSQLVTPHTSVPLKPKYRLGRYATFPNLEKARLGSHLRLFSLSKDEENAIEVLSEYSVSKFDERTMLPRYRTKSQQRPKYDKDIVNAALLAVAEFRGSDDRKITLSSQTVETARDLNPESHVRYARTGDGEPLRPSTTHKDEHVFSVSNQRYDHHTGKDTVLISQRENHESVIKKAELISELDSQLNTGARPKPIDLGFGISANSDDVVLAAMFANEQTESDTTSSTTGTTHTREVPVSSSRKQSQPTDHSAKRDIMSREAIYLGDLLRQSLKAPTGSVIDDVSFDTDVEEDQMDRNDPGFSF